MLPDQSSCRPVPHRTVQAVFPAYGSSAPVQRKSPVALSPIRIRSLAISPHLQVWLMFARLRSKTVEAFTPSALPDFSAIPASIPSYPSSVSPPFHSWSVILGQIQISSAKNVSGRLVRPCSPLLLDAVCDPGAGSVARLYRDCSVACVSSHSFGLLHCGFSGLFPDSASNASPRNLSSTPWFFVRFRCRVSVLSLSIKRRVPTYSMARITHFDQNTGWLTRPFPRGFAPP